MRESLWLALATAVVIAATLGFIDDGAASVADSAQDELDLPHVLTLGPGKALWVHGWRCTTSVMLRVEGGNLYVNDIRATPSRVIVREKPDSEMLARVFAEVPFVRARVSEGAGLAEAVELYMRERGRVTRVAERAHRNAMAGGVERAEASAIALQTLHDADANGLIDWEAPTSSPLDGLWFRWKGLRGDYMIGFSYDSVVEQDQSEVSEIRHSALRRFAGRLHGYLVLEPRPCWVFVHRDHTNVYCGQEDIEEVALQLSTALETGVATEYPLPPSVLGEILERRGVELRAGGETPPN